MDNTTTQQKSVVGKYFEAKLHKQRNKLVRSTECIGRVLQRQEELLQKDTTAAAAEDNGGSVMGGGFATPQTLQTAVANQAATTAVALEILQMHEKLLEKDDTSKEKTEKLKQLQKDTAAAASEKSTTTTTLKAQKDSKFAEKLRRSFRRGEHKSLEIKRTEKVESLHSPQDNSKFAAGLRAAGFPLLHKNSQSIFSLHNLPGLGGGHINPALLLDSPDEATPPEYAYQHLSSVATTNSSTSLESNFDTGEAHSSQSSISYWAWQQSNSSMGGEVSTASSGGAALPTASASGSRAAKELEQDQKKKRLEAQCSSKSDIQQVGVSHAPTSRSCSITSESSSAKLTRLQNFLFKSSNESSRSYQGHSNEAFTASSHNSSSGEWENLCNLPPSSSSNAPEFHVGSFPEESLDYAAQANTQAEAEEAEAGNYYQYTLTSPNNPFLPEIIARSYHSTYEEEPPPPRVPSEEEQQLDAHATCLHLLHYGSGSSGRLRGTHSAQLPTPDYSRAGSQESTHSEGGTSVCGMSTQIQPQAHTSSTASSSSSTPGRQKRKLFSLNSPTRHHLQHQSTQQQQQQQQAVASSIATTDIATATKSICASAGSKVRSLNPFLPVSSTTSLSSSHKRAPLKQSAITSPTAVPPDLHAKREEFLRATMKICLVVSPPTSKLQLKSKSLTHLDGLNTVVACQQGVSATPSAVTVGKPSTSGNNENSPASAAQHMLSPAVVGIPSAGTPTAGNVAHMGAYCGASVALGVTPASQKKKSSFMQRKKPLLTRSEVSSSEYFSVSFCTELGCQEEEFIPATKGVTLGTALSQVLKRRNLSFSQIIITDNNAAPSLLEAGYSPIASSLDENTHVENLSGRHLLISDRDGSRKTLQKAASFGSRARPPRLLSSASTEETSDLAASGGKQVKQRWSGIFGIKNPQQNQLCELLNNYAKNGVPQKSTAPNFDYPNFDAALEYLDNMHKSWKDFVESDGMSDSETKIQTAIWELVTTEVYYIHALQTVTELFLACLEAVQEERLLTDVDQHRLFSNVRDICEANLRFWTFYLYPMVMHSVATREPMRIGFFQEGFVAFATIFAPYKKYCAEQSTCQFYCKELNRNNALFTSYLAWCESQKMCNRLRLADILVRPMQRLTKYSLLLAAIKKHMSDVEEIEAVDTMIHAVENFVCSVNNHLTTRQENERLKGVMARLESYDVVDTNNEQLDKMIKQYSQMFDLCTPMKGCHAQHVRHLFMEGDHKYKDNLGKADVHCFLLTDMLLVCKTIAKKGLGALKVIRQPYLTDRLIVQHSNNILSCVYLNEFQVAVTAFSLQCSEAKNWYESLKRAKMIYIRLKQGASALTADSLGVKKSPMNSSICSHVSSANNSHSGSVEWNDSRNISVDIEKTNSLSSDEGSSLIGGHGFPLKVKNPTATPHKLKINTSSANTLSVQPLNHLGQSLPNLNLHHSHTNLYHTYSNNTLLVPGTTTSHSGNLLLSPSHRGISYPPPSPTRVPLRRGMAFTTSTKNPPLVKTRNITSQNSINWHQIPATPTPTSPQSQHTLPNASTTEVATTAAGAVPTTTNTSTTSAVGNNDPNTNRTAAITNTPGVSTADPQTTIIPLAIENTLQGSHCHSSTSTETDV